MQEPDILYIGKYSETFDTLHTYQKCKLHFESHISQSEGITSEHKLTNLLVILSLKSIQGLELVNCKLGGVGSNMHFSLLPMNRLNQTEPVFGGFQSFLLF
jgi:hypothetical protein